jgi:hypothetical protein
MAAVIKTTGHFQTAEITLYHFFTWSYLRTTEEEVHPYYKHAGGLCRRLPRVSVVPDISPVLHSVKRPGAVSFAGRDGNDTAGKWCTGNRPAGGADHSDQSALISVHGFLFIVV